MSLSITLYLLFGVFMYYKVIEDYLRSVLVIEVIGSVLTITLQVVFYEIAKLQLQH